MPLPLPNLDTRRWADLVEEGRALIPRYAPQWSDHNIHDPGITLIELFAWLIEADIYRTNRVPPRHRRKFLQLIGFAPKPPLPARAVLRFAAKSGQSPVRLPAGLVLNASAGGTQTPFRLLDELLVVDTEIAAVQSFDGEIYTDHTRAQAAHFSFPLWGMVPGISVSANPEKQPALYIGLSKTLPIDEPVHLWLRFAGTHSGSEERQRFMNERQAEQTACQPIYPIPECPPMVVTDPWCTPERCASTSSATVAGSTMPLHHSIRTAWDYWDGSAWRAFDDQVIDETRGFTLDGSVMFKLSTPMGAKSFGVVTDKFHYLRARLIAGPLDYLPAVSNIEINAMEVEQATSARATFVIRPGVSPAQKQEPQVGKLGYLNSELDKEGAITKLAFSSLGKGPGVRVVAYVPAKPTEPGSLTITLVFAGRGTGLPGLRLVVPGAPVVPSSMRVWTISNGKHEEWSMRPDLDASGRTDAHFALSAMTGELIFGDGERGRVVPRDTVVVASFDMTSAGNGNVLARTDWSLSHADNDFNRALLGADPKTVTDAFRMIGSAASVREGSDEEELEHAAGRAAETVWVHERLLELLAASDSLQTLDGLARNSVLALAAPLRATTLIDYERLALGVPGAPVSRARAWAGLDPDFPCLKAPGTVVVIVVPWLPANQPAPSPALLEAVRRYLDRRRLVGTRLVVAGPRYLKVSVQATLAVRAGARIERVLRQVRVALDSFLDPLSGGQHKRGWPFGRDVYRSEILEVIHGVAGVDHVEHLELVANKDEPQCGNLCVAPMTLVTPGAHILKVSDDLILKGGGHDCVEG